jgi:hypothetical protein
VFFRDMGVMTEKNGGCDKNKKRPTAIKRERALSRSFHHLMLFLFDFRGWERIRRGRVQGIMSTCSCLTGLN